MYDRAEKAVLIVTTNLPFSEWAQVFVKARLCGAVLDRVTDQAHIIETGGSYTASNAAWPSAVRLMNEVFATRHGLRAAFCTAPKGRAGWLGRAASVKSSH